MKINKLLLLLIVSGIGFTFDARSFGDESETKALAFGVGTPGGRGGKILRVTSLESEGPGSLRAAVEAKTPRIVVFEVAGVIDLNRNTLVVTNPFLTLAGQTAPPPGITIIKGGLLIKTHDVIVQHIAVRPGDAGAPRRSGWEQDAISTSADGAEGQVYNIVIDHCSGTWATDENISVSGPRNDNDNKTSHDITISNCIIAEGLVNSTHKKGIHSMGSLIMDGCTRIALIGNLFANNNQRHPLLKGGSSALIVNNLIVNPGNKSIHMVDFGHGKRLGKPIVTVLGNKMVHGKDTKRDLSLFVGNGDVYARDNIVERRDGKIITIGSQGDTPTLWHEEVKVMPTDEVADYVLSNVGSRPAERNDIDTRIVRESRKATGQLIDSQEEVGGYPAYRMTRRKLQIPETDVEKWLSQMADQVEKAPEKKNQK